MKYPIGIQNFESLISEGYLYIDKTSQIFKMVNEGKYYFISRPRRFGKSLTVSILEAYFSVKKELFKGLVIEKLEKDWKKSAEAALQQIEDRQYAKPFEFDNRALYKIGINFSTKTRKIDNWKIK